MVCIIDDREEVWNFAPNMIRVKPYIFFDGTADINAPPGFNKGGGDATDNNNGKTKREVRVIRVRKEKSHSKSQESKTENNTDVQETDHSEDMDCQKETESVENKKRTQDCAAADIDNTEECQKGTDQEKAQTQDSGEVVNIDKTEEKECTENVMEVEEPNVTTSINNEASSNSPKTETAKNTDRGHSFDTGKRKSLDIEDKLSKGDHNPQAVTSNNDPSKNTKEISQEDCKGEKIQETNNSEQDFEELIEWSDDDDYLLYLEEILTNIHKAYFKMYEQIKDKGSVKKEELPNLKKLIPYMKKKVLQGVNIVFSSVVPTNQPLEKSRAYYVAKSLGAEVHTEIKSDSTHLVAAKLGTQKVRNAVKQKGNMLIN